jgi:hypothetical protein
VFKSGVEIPVFYENSSVLFFSCLTYKYFFLATLKKNIIRNFFITLKETKLVKIYRTKKMSDAPIGKDDLGLIKAAKHDPTSAYYVESDKFDVEPVKVQDVLIS